MSIRDQIHHMGLRLSLLQLQSSSSRLHGRIRAFEARRGAQHGPTQPAGTARQGASPPSHFALRREGGEAAMADAEERSRLIAQPPAPPAAHQQPHNPFSHPHMYGRTIVALISVLFLLGGFVVLFMSSEEESMELPFTCAGELVPTLCMPACSPSCSAVEQGNCKAPCGPGCACPAERPVAVGNDRCVQTKLECPSVMVSNSKEARVEPPSASPGLVQITFATTESPSVGSTMSPAVRPTEPDASPIDFSSCEVPFTWREAKGYLSREAISSVEHVRLATAPCPGRADVMVHFTVVSQEKTRTCASPVPRYKLWIAKKGETANVVDNLPCVSCIQFGPHGQTMHNFAVRVSKLQPESLYVYEIGVDGPAGTRPMSREFVSPPLPGQSSAISNWGIIIGDTKDQGAKLNFPHMAKSNPHFILHVGDTTYVTNTGSCYGSHMHQEGPCHWNSTNTEAIKERYKVDSLLGSIEWAKILEGNVGGTAIWMTTPGNHDNDLLWFLTYRPPLNGSLPGVKKEDLSYSLDGMKDFGVHSVDVQSYNAVMLMKWPHFYSFDHGMLHVISLGSEDNPFGAYEQWDGKPHTAADLERFALHYGPHSRQFKWLENDLKQAGARRKLVPWIVIMTHRPMYHTGNHHAMCGPGGDWFGCRFRETYDPLLHEYRVNLFVSGHSHHYQRSHPMFMNTLANDSGTVHAVVGTGGFELTGDDFRPWPEWMASRHGTHYGYVRYHIPNATHLFWEYILVGPGDEGSVFDEAWIRNVGVA